MPGPAHRPAPRAAALALEPQPSPTAAASWPRWRGGGCCCSRRRGSQVDGANGCAALQKLGLRCWVRHTHWAASRAPLRAAPAPTSKRLQLVGFPLLRHGAASVLAPSSRRGQCWWAADNGAPEHRAAHRTAAATPTQNTGQPEHERDSPHRPTYRPYRYTPRRQWHRPDRPSPSRATSTTIRHHWPWYDAIPHCCCLCLCCCFEAAAVPPSQPCGR